MELIVHTRQERNELDDLYGLFFEDINHAADGGLYAELVQNRSFEFCSVDNADYHGLTAWEKIEDSGEIALTVRRGDAVSSQNPHYLELNVTEPGEVGIQNLGFNSGIPLRKGAAYYLTFYARTHDASATGITASLRKGDGKVYQEATFRLTDVWEKYETVFTAMEDDWAGRLAMTVEGIGRVDLDFVSLFPADTYKGRKNGLRRDLAEALEAMHPKFLRFPGGCLTHDGSLRAEDRNAMYRWKNSIGQVEHRPARKNNWGYNQTLGLGFYEYFLLCEDIGAKPLPVLPAGYDPHHHWGAEGILLQEFIQDALDLIEFANGTPDTVWGRKRAEMGHPAPFHMEYLGIGNEEVGEGFFTRYPRFYQAIKEVYPEIKVVGTSGPFSAGPEYERGWRSAREDGAELVDEHYYQSPAWFIANQHRYDSFPAENPKVFLGEYAAKGNTWFDALAEASYMVGLERNAHAVKLACYAPLFCNKDYANWQPDMIWFDNHQLMRTPNYYVQQMFMVNQGDVSLVQELHGAGAAVKLYPFPDSLSGELMLSSEGSQVEFSDIVITDSDTGKRQTFPKPILCQGSEMCRITQVPLTNYTISLKATLLAGQNCGRVWFAHRDDGDGFFWMLGTWGNGSSLLIERSLGTDAALSYRERYMEQGKTYRLEIRVTGRKVQTFVNGETEAEVEAISPMAEQVYAVSSRDRHSGDTILKLVNVLPKRQVITVTLDGMTSAEGTACVLGGYDREARNTLGQPEKIVPGEERVSFDTGTFQWELAPESVCVLRLREKKRHSR